MKHLLPSLFFLTLVSPALADEVLYLYGAQREAYQQKWESQAQTYEGESFSYLENLYATHGTVNAVATDVIMPDPPSAPMEDTQHLNIPALPDDFGQ